MELSNISFKGAFITKSEKQAKKFVKQVINLQPPQTQNKDEYAKQIALNTLPTFNNSNTILVVTGEDTLTLAKAKLNINNGQIARGCDFIKELLAKAQIIK